MSTLREQGRALAAAITFMTRIPLGSVATHDPADLPASAVYFPVVGLIVALGGGLAFAIASSLWSTTVSVLLSMCATVLMTGAFHEDALADALDGFGGGWTPERVLAIMKDSRIGSYALVGVVLVLGVKAAILMDVASRDRAAGITRTLIAGHVLGRWSSVPLIWRYPYVRPPSDAERPSAGRPFVASVTMERLVAATLIAVLLVVLAVGALDGLVLVVVAVGVTTLAGSFFRRRIGGITGDALGATNQIVELSVYLAFAARVQGAVVR